MKLRRLIGTFSAAAVMLSALSFRAAATETRLNVTGRYITVTGTSTLYCGEITEKGKTLLRYLWSEDITNTTTVFGEVKDCLNGMEDKSFAELIPAEFDEESKGLAVCSEKNFTSYMNSDWKTAEGAANRIYNEPAIKSKSSSDLYTRDEGFAAACHRWDEDVPEENISDQDGQPFAVTCPLGKLSAVNTDIVTYTVENGVLIKHIDRKINYTCEAVTVIYTTADIQRKTVSSISAKEQPKSNTAVYLGEVVSEDGSSFKYVWSDGLDVCMDSVAPLKTALAGMEDQDFLALIPELYYDEGTGSYNISKLAFCSDPEKQEDMNAEWSSAEAVGKKYFPGLCPAVTVSGALYDCDAGFAAAVDALDAERKADISEPIDADKSIIWHSDSGVWTDVYYTIEDGVVVRHLDLHITYLCDGITVNYTKAEMKTVNVRKGDVNNDGVVDVTDLTVLARSLAHWPGYDEQINEANADIDGKDGVTAVDYTILARALARWPGYAEDYGITIG
ncbi:MAG: dockerin type I repeat-containing protein [Ruminococcus sp.]|nr:dockerin type I repeat-containing protein [Ruminococcus sp.]